MPPTDHTATPASESVDPKSAMLMRPPFTSQVAGGPPYAVHDTRWVTGQAETVIWMQRQRSASASRYNHFRAALLGSIANRLSGSSAVVLADPSAKVALAVKRNMIGIMAQGGKSLG